MYVHAVFDTWWPYPKWRPSEAQLATPQQSLVTTAVSVCHKATENRLVCRSPLAEVLVSERGSNQIGFDCVGVHSTEPAAFPLLCSDSLRGLLPRSYSVLSSVLLSSGFGFWVCVLAEKFVMLSPVLFCCVLFWPFVFCSALFSAVLFCVLLLCSGVTSSVLFGSVLHFDPLCSVLFSCSLFSCFFAFICSVYFSVISALLFSLLCLVQFSSPLFSNPPLSSPPSSAFEALSSGTIHFLMIMSQESASPGCNYVEDKHYNHLFA